MKKIFKIFLGIIIFVVFLTSIFYGLRINNTLYEYQYLTNSLVVTIPNKLWFETNSQQDYLLKDETTKYIFSDNLLEHTRSGSDIGPLYPTYVANIKNDSAKKTDIVTRKTQTLSIDRVVELQSPNDYKYYVSQIALSEFGEYTGNTFEQEGCSIGVTSQNGEVSYKEANSVLLISYMINGNKNIKDHIAITIECKK